MSMEQMIHYQSKLFYKLDSADLFSAISRK